MAWEWSHTAEAYRCAYENLAGLTIKSLREIYGEWMAHGGGDDEFDEEKYHKAYEETKYIPTSTLVDYIWQHAEELRTCTNGGWEAWVCPSGCHTVSFSRDAQLVRRARARHLLD